MTDQGPDHLSKGEIAKDALQASAEAAATAVGEVATIITGAVRDVASAVGGFATEIFEIREASRRALAEHGELADLERGAGTDVGHGEDALDPGPPTPELDDPAERA